MGRGPPTLRIAGPTGSGGGDSIPADPLRTPQRATAPRPRSLRVSVWNLAAPARPAIMNSVVSEDVARSRRVGDLMSEEVAFLLQQKFPRVSQCLGECDQIFIFTALPYFPELIANHEIINTFILKSKYRY